MLVYSPSSRTDFSFCPRSWWFRKKGWVLRKITYPELCGIGGGAVSEAMCFWNKARIMGTPISLEECIGRGLQHVVVSLAELASQERRVSGLKDREFADVLPTHVENAVRLLWSANPLGQHRILSAEEAYPEYGDARPDVISFNKDGEKVVDDYKCKFSPFDVAWMDKEFEKHWDGEQRLQYTSMTGCTLFGIIMVLIQPHSKKKPMQPSVIRRVSRVHDYEHKLWLSDAAMDKVRMDQTLERESAWLVPGKAAPHANMYGDCVYRDACVECGLDHEKMNVNYIQIERNGDEKV